MYTYTPNLHITIRLHWKFRRLHFTALDVLQWRSPSANNRYKVDIRQTEVASR